METSAPSPRGVPLGLSKLLRKDRENVDASINPQATSSYNGVHAPGNFQDDVSENSGLRASMESAIDKVKERTRRRSVDDRGLERRDSDDSRRLSTLVSKTKRKVKRSLKVADADSERNTSIDSGSGSRLGTSELELAGNHSNSSLLQYESGHSSLLTDDERSDQDCERIKPPLLSRHSHKGYLTLSSTEINAQTSPVLPVSDVPASTDPIPAADLPAIDPKLPHIVEPSNTSSSSFASIPDRSSSPSGKLRSAWTLPRKKSGGDTEPAKTLGGGGSGLGGIFRTSSRRNSINTQNSSEQDTPPSLPPKDDIGGGNSNKSGSKQGVLPATPKHLSLKTAIPSTPQSLHEPPTTLVTPPTPVTDTHADSLTFTKTFPAARGSGSVESIRHRRAQSANLPSRLSTSISAPLPPTLEETKTPGGTLTSPNPTAGFFSSVFSVAQKAGAQFSNTIIPAQKSKSTGTIPLDTSETEEVIPGPESRPGTAPEGEKKALAVETLGKGSLSLSHLGIVDSADRVTMPSAAELQQHDAQTQNGQEVRKAEEEAAARAVSSAYEKPAPSAMGEAVGRPMSVASTDRLTTAGEQTPPRTAINGSIGGIKRSGSVRSKVSGRRKHRTSSATQATSSSIAAAIINSSSGLANPAISNPGHRLTGFAVASNKRNKDFHQLFRSVPEDDYLIEDYSAALQRDILLHGRLYVSEGHICFSSNILGWVTNLVISFDEVVSVEKKSTAVIFPNAIVISTLNARNTFASFVARDSSYELLIGIWKISHPKLKSSLNGVQLDEGGTGDRTEVAEAELSDGDTDDATEDEVYDEDDDDDAGSFTDGGMVASNVGSELGDSTLSRKPSAAAVGAYSPPTGAASRGGLESADAVVTGAAMCSEFPGTATHEPTQCTETGEHYDRPLTDATIPAPLGKVYSLMFGPASGAFMRKWLVEDQKSRELNYEDDKTGLDNEHTSFTFDYIKPLNGAVGPRQTKCITTNIVKAFDLEKAVSIDCSTQTPDVPSGNVFTTKTRYCLMWGPGNSTRMIASCTIEWTGKSWLKGPIEKGANDGQISYVKSIVAALEAAVTAKPPVKGMVRKGKRKDKKEVFDAEAAVAKREAAIAAVQQSSSWGSLEPVRQILDPISSIIGPLITSQVIIVVLILLLVYSWFFSSGRGATGVGSHVHSPERMVAYEAIWQREENALWDWLDDRVGLRDDILSGRQKVLQAKSMGKKLEGERMQGRQMDNAIRTTEERLQALKDAVGRKNEKEGIKRRATG